MQTHGPDRTMRCVGIARAVRSSLANAVLTWRVRYVLSVSGTHPRRVSRQRGAMPASRRHNCRRLDACSGVPRLRFLEVSRAVRERESHVRVHVVVVVHTLCHERSVQPRLCRCSSSG
eukprot:3154651-Rhodomonas_salina.1